jgi:hypothetical protein
MWLCRPIQMAIRRRKSIDSMSYLSPPGQRRISGYGVRRTRPKRDLRFSGEMGHMIIGVENTQANSN